MSLLYKLGLRKLTLEQYLKIVSESIEETTELILNDDSIKESSLVEKKDVYDLKLAKCELKLFLWIVIIELANKVPNELLYKINRLMRNEVVFSSVTNYDLSEDFKTKIVKQRMDFHKDNYMFKNEFSEKYKIQFQHLLYNEPFLDIKKIEDLISVNGEDLSIVGGGFVGSLMYRQELNNLLEITAPLFKKGIFNVSKYVDSKCLN